MDAATRKLRRAQYTRIRQFLKANPYETIDYCPLVEHLRAEPGMATFGFFWRDLVAHYFDMYNPSTKASALFVANVLQVLLDAGVLNEEQTRSHLPPSSTFKGHYWYRIDVPVAT